MILNGKLIPIPPFNPETQFGRAQAVFAAANSLAQAASMKKELSGELIAVAQKLTQEAVGQLTKAFSRASRQKAPEPGDLLRGDLLNDLTKFGSLGRDLTIFFQQTTFSAALAPQAY